MLVNDNHEASLIDFGLSRILQQSGFTTKTMAGSWRWMAPELFNEIEGQPNPRVTAASDTYSFSMTVIEVSPSLASISSALLTILQIFTGSMPFADVRNDALVVHHVLGGKRPKRETCQEIDQNLWNILQSCWNTDPTQRPSMSTVLAFLQSHPKHQA